MGLFVALANWNNCHNQQDDLCNPNIIMSFNTNFCSLLIFPSIRDFQHRGSQESKQKLSMSKSKRVICNCRLSLQLSFCRSHRPSSADHWFSSTCSRPALNWCKHCCILCWSYSICNREYLFSWPSCQSGLPPVAQPAFLVRSHLVLIAWNLSYKPPGHLILLTKIVLNEYETTWFHLWDCGCRWD